ncbi:MAG: nicotinamide-nucleotide amidohydrolase family protein [Bacilli bacterium]|jgi:nicotinamide-nucleotide amidase|nr:nicotinamide-nucleotide amidohydrolase family protein [Bacilli bacterium]MDY0064041.1 nicotinamide-nucleotide amidohydrolase family protein [Bacilli bacterium]
MKAYILNIGNEVLSGKVVNTNASYLALECEKLGIETVKTVVVSDTAADIETVLYDFLSSNADLLFTTGGLGPTHDDITKDSIAKVCQLKMVYYEQANQDMAAYFGENKQDCNLKQSYFPQGAKILQNKVGSADGAFLSYQNKSICMLVGPQEELKQMFKQEVVPLISVSERLLVFQDYYVMGNTESYFEMLLQPLIEKYPNVSIAPYASYGLIRFRLQALVGNKKVLQACEQEFETSMHEYIISKKTDRIEEIIVEELQNRTWQMGCAESITGGLITQMLTSVPGASNVIFASVIPYQEQAKSQLLNVDVNTIRQFGIVSEEVALEMVRGLWQKGPFHLAVAITGFAGPTGEDIGKVSFAIKTVDREFYKTVHLRGNRDMIRIRAARQLLYEVFKILKKYPIEGQNERK